MLGSEYLVSVSEIVILPVDQKLFFFPDLWGFIFLFIFFDQCTVCLFRPSNYLSILKIS
jgi:hypothetical protein